MQPEFKAIYGVQRCIVGYSGGFEENPTYSAMKDHTESVLVEFEKRLLSYDEILGKWKDLSSPYAAKRQYRTAIFYLNERQGRIASSVAADMEDVDVEPATRFYVAEQSHQDFLSRQ